MKTRDFYRLQFRKTTDRLYATAAGRLLREALDRRRLGRWHGQGCPFRTPHAYKQKLACCCGRQYALKAFVETGTQHGDMLAGVQHTFDRLYSIELHPDLFEFARQRFAGNGNIRLLMGDSANLLPDLIRQLDGPALFFLDAHFFRHGVSARGEKESPVLEELAAILADRRRHVILIDDARCFTPDRGFPAMEKLHDLVKTRDDLALACSLDIIRIFPKDEPVKEPL